MSRSESEQIIIRYLSGMRNGRGIGTAETSFYPPLKDLLDGIGDTLNPKIIAHPHPRDSGAGIPDFALYTAEQIKRAKGELENPARGVVEVKSSAEELDDLVKSEQIAKYVTKYGLVLATNYRQFALLEANSGRIKEIARCTIAASEEEFWEKAEHPQKTAKECTATVGEFLRRALSHNAPITTAKDIAVILASYARETLELLETNNDDNAVQVLRESLEKALSMKFTGENGAHFFHSTLAQTIFYGLFSAWMKTSASTFNWRSAVYEINTPVISALFAEIVNPDRLGRLGLEDLLDNATAALNRVEGKETLFGGMNAPEAIQHFYEPFLAEFDSKLRKDLGVWYTPPEIVRYMVERVDMVLRTEMGKADGLADENVYVLDPCSGTGAYIAEVLRRIRRTCEERGDGALVGQLVKKAAMQRIFGFEILSASYVVAHWQIGALLEEMGAALKKDERAAIYLTNSLTNWTEEDDNDISLPFPALTEERDAANKIKREQPILVILGNPPYNAFAGTSPIEEEEEGEGLVTPYKKGLAEEWGITSFNLNDLYIRFFRVAENRINKTGKGIISFISNYSYTNDRTFVLMRQSLLKNFNKIWIDSLNGDSRATGKKTPSGQPDPSVFSTPLNKEGIRVGTAIGTFISNDKPANQKQTVMFRNFWGTQKREDLEASLNVSNFDSQYQVANPQQWNNLSFHPLDVSKDFLRWESLGELCQSYFDGLGECRGGALSDNDSEPLEKRMRDYFNKELDWEFYSAKGGGLAKNASGFDAKKTREKALKIDQYNPDHIVPHTMRPFDNGFCYYTGLNPIWSRSRPKLWEQFKPGNSFLLSRKSKSVQDEGTPMFFTNHISDRGAMSGIAQHIPFHLYKNEPNGEKIQTANLSETARKYLDDLGFDNPDKNPQIAEMIWLHALAITYSPNYQTENRDGLKIGWPRIPLPKTREVLQNSAQLGAAIRDLLDMETPLNLQTPIGQQLIQLAKLHGDATDLSASNTWGRQDGSGKTFPGQGIIVKPTENLQIIKNLPAEFHQLGEMWDIQLNPNARWSVVPEKAWEYRIGGFQPAKKWLSYRAHQVLGRALTTTEIRQFADIIRRITALILKAPLLNQNYATTKTTQ